MNRINFVRMKLICCVFLFCFYSLAALGQASIRGCVVLDDLPAPGASVQLDNRQVVADEKGCFFLDGLNAGKYRLHVSRVGAEAFQQQVMLKEGEESYLDIRLEPESVSLDAVVVSGTLRPVKKLESPIPVEVYTPQFFKKNPAPSIFESLQNVNGVRPQINCSVCNTGDIHMNGLEGPYTMVTIDGMPIVSSLASIYGLFGIPTELIDRVEIVKGPASGLYGSEAIGGLINVITKSPKRAPKFSANVMATNWQEITTDLGFRLQVNKKFHSLLGLNYFQYQQPIDKNGDHFTDVTLQRRISVFGKWSLERKAGRTGSLAGRYFYENRWGGEMNWNANFRGSDSIYGESIDTKRWELIGNYQLPLDELVMLSFSATGHKQDSYYGKLPYLAKQNIVFLQAVWQKEFSSRLQFLLGLAGRYQYYDDNSTATRDTLTGTNRPDASVLPGIFAQQEWKLSPDHHLLMGIRLDHHPVHHLIPTPRVAYKWSVSERESFRINGGTGFRVVNIFTEDHAALTGARVVVIAEKLKPETSYNVNINYTRELGSPSLHFNLDGSVWYSHFNNQIIADYDSDPAKIIYANLKGYSVSRGASLNVEASVLKRLKAFLGFTVLNVHKTEIVNGKPVRLRPVLTENWSGVWSVSYSLPLQGITFDYTGNVYSPMRLPLTSALDPRRPYSPVWSLQNIQVTKWMSSRVEIFGGVKNLLNWTPAKNLPFLIARSHDPFNKNVNYDASGNVLATAENPYALTFDPSYTYAPNQGIRFFSGMRFKLK